MTASWLASPQAPRIAVTRAPGSLPFASIPSASRHAPGPAIQIGQPASAAKSGKRASTIARFANHAVETGVGGSISSISSRCAAPSFPASQQASESDEISDVAGMSVAAATMRAGDQIAMRRVAIAARLGFGAADVVVAVPDVWYDVATMADLDDVAADFRQRHGRRLRIATKYWRLTQRFFSQMHGIQVYRIVESLGATEGAPAAGSADVIVDITSTGATLDANHLRVLEDGVILKSQACLVAARKERSPGDAEVLEAVTRRFG